MRKYYYIPFSANATWFIKDFPNGKIVKSPYQKSSLSFVRVNTLEEVTEYYHYFEASNVKEAYQLLTRRS